MKYCKNCKKKIETETDICPFCGEKLLVITNDSIDENEAAEIVSVMTITGII